MQADAGERGDPRPDRVELPHVTQVSERREARAAVGEDAHDGIGSKRALLATYGPSPTKVLTRPPPTIANADAPSIRTRHGTVAEAVARRCGNAEPMVSAPMRTPSAAPRRSANHPAAIFMPGGYTHASEMPVAIRSAIRLNGVGAPTRPALATAPQMQPAAKSRRGLMTSGRFRIADASVPMTNPPWTAIVSHAASPDVRWNSATIGAVAAVAENQSVMPRNIASDSHASCRRATAGRRWCYHRRHRARTPRRTVSA